MCECEGCFTDAHDEQQQQQQGEVCDECNGVGSVTYVFNYVSLIIIFI